MNTKSLRNTVLLAAGLLAMSASPMLASAAAIPQDAGQTQAAPDQGKRSRPDLNLSDDQKAQMKKIHEDARSQIAAVNNDSSLSADQKQAKLRSIHMSTHKQTEALLTPEQRQTQKQWRHSHPHQNQNEEQQPPAAS
jgi:Spy/CpxP family protein refolding chaperone